MNRLMDLETPFSDKVGDDEFIARFMRPDIKFKSEADELKHLRSAQSILTAYKFLDEQGLLRSYREYRDL